MARINPFFRLSSDSLVLFSCPSKSYSNPGYRSISFGRKFLLRSATILLAFAIDSSRFEITVITRFLSTL
jgi:hypothetical protein